MMQINILDANERINPIIISWTFMVANTCHAEALPEICRLNAKLSKSKLLVKLVPFMQN